MRSATTLLAVTLALSTAACGSRSTDDASVDSLARHLTGKDSSVGLRLTSKQAHCLAKLYLKSDLSDAALDAVKDGKPLQPETKDDAAAMNDLSTKIAEKCL